MEGEEKEKEGREEIRTERKVDIFIHCRLVGGGLSFLKGQKEGRVLGDD